MRLTLLLLFLALTGSAAQEPARGSLLVASPASTDPDFDRSVVLLLRSDAQGSVGLIVNQPSPVPVGTLFSSARTGVIYKGGPLRMGINCLVRQKGAGRSLVFGDVYLISGKPEIEALASHSRPDLPLRIYVGLCGWTAGQLQGELRRGVWSLHTPDAGIVFDPLPQSVWLKLIANPNGIR